MPFSHLTISEAAAALAKKKFSARELVDYYFKKIEEHKKMNAFLYLNKEEARLQAQVVDQKISRGESLGLLAGMPVAVKDVILAEGQPASAGSRILENYIAPYDATCVAKLKAEGAIILGKVNCDEFAMGSSNENSAYGPVLNPWDETRVSGGSSGGSAAAVAEDLCLFSLGTDTGGSIRQPASFCGVVGLKPTYGRVSRYGLIAMTSSLDQAGPVTRSVEDSARVLEIISGEDFHDSSSLAATRFKKGLPYLKKTIKGLKIGVPKEYFVAGLESSVEKAVLDALETLKKLGAVVKEVSLPSTAYSLAAYYLISTAEVSSNLAKYDGILFGASSPEAKSLEELYVLNRDQFGTEAKRRIILGTFVLSKGYQNQYYKSALLARKKIIQEYDEIFRQVDVLATPTTPTAAFKLGEKTSDPLTMYLSDIYTVAANIANLCGISLPCGFTANGISANLPIGLQFLGPSFGEETILSLAHNFEKNTDFHLKYP